jgi:hypothetical protein|tara:strand:+ start:4775 stop:5017 length:243 start_codon:yes stop_codon:yes gene_type:complete
LIHKKYEPRNKGWFEEWIDLSFMEKLISIMWCGIPYMLWMIAEDVIVMYRIPIVIVIWILMTLLCYWFGHFMSSDQRDWN